MHKAGGLKDGQMGLRGGSGSGSTAIRLQRRLDGVFSHCELSYRNNGRMADDRWQMEHVARPSRRTSDMTNGRQSGSGRRQQGTHAKNGRSTGRRIRIASMSAKSWINNGGQGRWTADGRWMDDGWTMVGGLMGRSKNSKQIGPEGAKGSERKEAKRTGKGTAGGQNSPGFGGCRLCVWQAVMGRWEMQRDGQGKNGRGGPGGSFPLDAAGLFDGE